MLLAGVGYGLVNPNILRATPPCGNPPQPRDACGVCGGTTEDPDCCPGNGGGSGGGSASPGPVPGPGANPFNPFSGSVGLEIPELELAHLTGERPLHVTRYFASRWDAFPHIAFETPFGDAGNTGGTATCGALSTRAPMPSARKSCGLFIPPAASGISIRIRPTPCT